jgi:hypothetical protein
MAFVQGQGRWTLGQPPLGQSAPQRGALYPVIKQLMTEATPEALDAALAQADIAVEQIIAIHAVESNEGSGPGRVRREFRVLYAEA